MRGRPATACDDMPPASLGHPLPRAFYARPTLDVARDLIGKVLVHVSSSGITAGAIVEVEAYIGESDPACHAAAGFTGRNAPLYGPPGQAYVYLNYGLHYLVNAVTEPEGAPAAVLLRAVEPLHGCEVMQQRRARTSRGSQDLCRGPGNLTQAFGISLSHNGCDLTGERLFVADCGFTCAVDWTPRIGIRVGTDRRWRCHATDSPAVSGSVELAYRAYCGRACETGTSNEIRSPARRTPSVTVLPMGESDNNRR